MLDMHNNYHSFLARSANVRCPCTSLKEPIRLPYNSNSTNYVIRSLVLFVHWLQFACAQHQHINLTHSNVRHTYVIRTTIARGACELHINRIFIKIKLWKKSPKGYENQQFYQHTKSNQRFSSIKPPSKYQNKTNKYVILTKMECK